MFASVLSATILGMEVCPIRVEADVSDGLPCFTMVGFASAQVKEAQDRVRTALRNCGISLPPKRVTVNFAPADIRKEGAGFDMPVAAAVLAASGMLPPQLLEDVMLVGEVSLNGEIRAVSGVLPRVIRARELGCRYCLIPYGNLAEGVLVRDMKVIGVRSLPEMLEYIRQPELFGRGKAAAAPVPSDPSPGRAAAPVPSGLSPGNAASVPSGPLSEARVSSGQSPAGLASPSLAQEQVDFMDICGQEGARRAAEIAVSGFHNILFIGPPGAGKTMLARRIPTIMPSLTFEESLELTKIYSIAGLLSPENPLITNRPFRSPHHTSSPQALAGGGRVPSPGEVTLAHRGVLFLDELPEFSRTSLEVLRQPLEDKKIQLSRASGTFVFPAGFILAAAMNPCPCGCYPDMNRCRCTPGEVAHYLRKLSQPLLDRIDLCTDVPAVSFSQMESPRPGESSASIRVRVERTREIQAQRYAGEPICFNGELSGKLVKKYCVLTRDAARLLGNAFETMQFSARSYHRILKVSRTVADMDKEEKIHARHVAEALAYRAFDQKYHG